MFKIRKRRCSFCRKNEDQVEKLVAGKSGYICEKCTSVAHEIMNRPNPPNPPIYGNKTVNG